MGRQHGNRGRGKGRWAPPAQAYAPTPQKQSPRPCQVWLHYTDGRVPVSSPDNDQRQWRRTLLLICGLTPPAFGRFLGLVERDSFGRLAAARAAPDRLLHLFQGAEAGPNGGRLAG